MTAPETPLTQEEFCARFKAHMLEIAGEKTFDGKSVADHADEMAPVYWREEWLRREGPEACAQLDIFHWEN